MLLFIAADRITILSGPNFNTNQHQTDGTVDGLKNDTSIKNTTPNNSPATDHQSDETRLVFEELEIQKRENKRLLDDQKKRSDEIQQLLDEKERVKALQLEIEQENKHLKKIKEDQLIEIEKQKKKLEWEKQEHEEAALLLRRQAEEDEKKKRDLQDEINRNQLELIRQKEDLMKQKEVADKKECLKKEKEHEDKKARDKSFNQHDEADRKEPLKKGKGDEFKKPKDNLKKPQDEADRKEPLKNEKEDKNQQGKDKLKKPQDQAGIKQLLKNDKEDEDNQLNQEHIDESNETKSGDTKDIKKEPDANYDLMFEFDSDGLPIWAEKEIPLSVLPDLPPKW